MVSFSLLWSFHPANLGIINPCTTDGTINFNNQCAIRMGVCLKESLNNLAEFWQRQVFKFKALILSIVILWLKSITKKLETWLSPVGRAYKASIPLLLFFAKGTTILKKYA